MSMSSIAHRRPFPLRGVLVGRKYQIGPVIGSGGVGTVYRATHAWTEREVAVKVLDPTLPHFEHVRAAFLTEARATVQLEHPNVVDVLDMGEDGAETTYMVMELLHGPTLRDVLLERGSLSVEETLYILMPLIDALEKAHDLGIVHRDFKPENIILSVDTHGNVTPKLLDFGVAQILQDRGSGAAGSEEPVVGTPQYMSPEQARHQRELIGPHTDVWGVGVVWYECLTGRSPFERGDDTETLHAVCEAPIDFEGVPESHIPLLQDALQRSPDQRIATLSELRARMDAHGITSDEETAGLARRSSPIDPVVRESYVRETLPGTNANARLPTHSQAGAVELAQRRQPPVSRRGMTAFEIALCLLVALGAWWTASRSGTDSPATEAPATGDSVIVEAEPELPPWPAESLTPTRQHGAVDAPAAPAPDLADSIDTPAPSAPESAEPVETPAAARPAPGGRKPRAARKSAKYQRPPDLVTEW